MTDIDPQADIEVHSADEHVTVRVPLAGAVTGEWLRCYQKLALAKEVPSNPRCVMTGPGLSSVCQPAVARGKWRRRWTLPGL